MIDLHLHTTASDGRCTPAELVGRAAAAGVTVMAVTDHDTTAASVESQMLARTRGIEAVAGIEITAIEQERDVHVLGYFIDPDAAALARFLTRQREQRVARIEAMCERLAALGVPVDMAPALARARAEPSWSIGRPEVARALVAAGHAADMQDAFDRFIATGRPGFVPRAGASPETVFAVIHEAGGLASLAHPGLTSLDGRIEAWSRAGLDALEAHHSEHDDVTTARYLALALRLGLLVTGGSDFHGDPEHGGEPGSVTLPAEGWVRLRAAAHA